MGQFEVIETPRALFPKISVIFWIVPTSLCWRSGNAFLCKMCWLELYFCWEKQKLTRSEVKLFWSANTIAIMCNLLITPPSLVWVVSDECWKIAEISVSYWVWWVYFGEVSSFEACGRKVKYYSESIIYFYQYLSDKYIFTSTMRDVDLPAHIQQKHK